MNSGTGLDRCREFGDLLVCEELLVRLDLLRKLEPRCPLLRLESAQIRDSDRAEAENDVVSDDALHAVEGRCSEIGPAVDPRGHPGADGYPRSTRVDIAPGVLGDFYGGEEHLGLALGPKPALVSLAVVRLGVSHAIPLAC